MLTIRRTWRTAATAAFATAALAVGTPAAHAAPTTLVLDAQENYYLPTEGEGPNLDLGITASGGDAHDVSVAVDASSLAGKATMVVTGDCESTGALKVRCDVGPLSGGESIDPFFLKPTASAKAGDTGAITYTAIASDAATVTGKTDVLVGGPKLVTRPYPALKGIAPGAVFERTPAFADTGAVPSDKGVMLLVQDSDGVSLARDHSNCHYSDRPDIGAWCRFDTPVAPGAAYETNAPLRYTAAADTMYGYNTYVVWPVGGSAPDSFDPSDFPETGTGAPLGLKAVASGSGFTGSGYGTFATIQHADFQALGDTVEGKVGETVSITVGVENTGPGRMGLQWMDADNSGTFVVTPPAGTTITGAPGPGEQGDPGPLWNCTPQKAGAKSYTCDIANTDFEPGDSVTQEFTVRIDRVVPGARGSVKAVENPDFPNRDDDAANDTAVIAVKATGSATSSPSPSASASPSATPVASPSGSGAGGGSGTTTDGGLAATGTDGVLLRAGIAALLVAGGTLVFLAARRSRLQRGR
ncbi:MULTISPECIES: hypothetical protein [unclassified Streptomyces]|uniref:hypothetical protein n=1 Tax=unclassified Streptomyces TaxID=2593676 RepID=UPI002474591A|nr:MULTISPECIES: hypothetical protein [unclassified Streptomyces]MDH6455745.1 hypothetical protein [Streptomyces sp. SAI-119]MDH6502326.1 hypothetical protein [Streptomyces sp. SAI-149]